MTNAYLIRDGAIPSNSLTPKIRKLAKNLVFFSLYRRGLLGKLRQTFLPASNFAIACYPLDTLLNPFNDRAAIRLGFATHSSLT